MADSHDTPAVPDTSASPVPDPSTWRTGDEPPTHRQQAYLETLAQEAGEELPENLTKAQASEMIDQLRHETDRDDTPVHQPSSSPNS